MELTDAVRTVAAPILAAQSARYARRCSWARDARPDLEQAAWEALLRAPAFDAERASLPAYVATVATRTMWRAVHKLRAPVSASHRVKVLAGLVPVGLEAPCECDESRDEPRAELPEVAELNTARADTGAVAARVRARLVELLGVERAALVLEAYGVEVPAAEQAAAHALTAREVYRFRDRTKVRLAADPVLLELWNE